MKTYIYEEYLKPLELINSQIAFKKFSDIKTNEEDQLIKMYVSLFNADNIKLIKKLGIEGRTKVEGLWSEDPYKYKDVKEMFLEYASVDYFGVAAYYSGENYTSAMLGASVFQKRSKPEMMNKGYVLPFEIPQDAGFWCEIDIFRRPILSSSTNFKNIAGKMREKIAEIYKGDVPVLIYSSTNNPQMVKSWESDGFTVVERNTSFGNKYQAFKLIS